MNLEQVLKLPQGRIREPELKKIPDIFSRDNLDIALAILNGVNDCNYVVFQADILERAYKYGWNRKELQLETSSNLPEKKKDLSFESFRLFCVIAWDFSCLLAVVLIVFGTLSYVSYVSWESFQESTEIIEKKP